MDAKNLYTYRVASVENLVDGDTLDILIDIGFGTYSAQRIRMYGIDTPEIRTRDREEKRFGLLAKEFLYLKFLRAAEAGKVVVIHTQKGSALGDSRSKYGDYLGEFFVDGKSINEEMVNRHHAVKYLGGRKADSLPAHLENRKRLQAAKADILSEPPLSYRRILFDR